jgi:uncharacterized protein YecA (UPF0149 family)
MLAAAGPWTSCSAKGNPTMLVGWPARRTLPTYPRKRLHAMKPSTGSTRADRIGRNAPCPCGSGKKFKDCCLRA